MFGGRGVGDEDEGVGTVGATVGGAVSRGAPEDETAVPEHAETSIPRAARRTNALRMPETLARRGIYPGIWWEPVRRPPPTLRCAPGHLPLKGREEGRGSAVSATCV